MQERVKQDCPSRTLGPQECSLDYGSLLLARGLGSTLASVLKVAPELG